MECKMELFNEDGRKWENESIRVDALDTEEDVWGRKLVAFHHNDQHFYIRAQDLILLGRMLEEHKAFDV